MHARIIVPGLAFLAALLLATSLPYAQDDTAPMDNAAMAASYEAEATQAKTKAADHERMLKRYQAMPISPKASGISKSDMTKHCRKLIDSYNEAAAQATDLAKAHREAAAASN